MHLGLLGANQPQRSPAVADAAQTALTSGSNKVKAGHFSEALPDLTTALRIARQHGDLKQASEALRWMAISHTRLFEYRAGMASALESRRLALETGEQAMAGSASIDIATIYGQLGDFVSAEREAGKAVELLQAVQNPSLSDRSNLVKALLNHAMLSFLDGRPLDAEKWSDKGIAYATKLGNPQLEAIAWETRGTMLLRDRKIAAAEKAFNKEYELRQAAHDENGLAVIKAHLAELELEKDQPDFKLALRRIDEAFSAPSSSFRTNAQWYPIRTRARILLGSGKKMEALAEFRRAVESADQWRQGALPGSTTGTQTVVWLDQVYSDFAQLAAEISLERHMPELGREGLEVLARNRAASLREQLTLAFGHSFRLSDGYFKKLSELQGAQARVTLGRNTTKDTAELERIRYELTDLENQIGLKPDKNLVSGEKNSRKISLRDIQARLRKEQGLLSFCLGKQRSFVWAVTGQKVNLYQLDSEREIGALATRFSANVRGGRDMPRAGTELSRVLFGQLDADFRQKSEWLIVADGSLLAGVPFAGLPSPLSECCKSLLIANHSLRFLPSELLLLASKDSMPAPRFVGVADPIYNTADSRLVHKMDGTGSLEDASTISLARLVGSEREVRNAARLSGMSKELLLLGPRATSEDLQKSLADDPELVHFAVHVVSPPEQAQEAALALSLRGGIPELLTPEAIATFRVPGSLIVLSGCASGQGKKLPGAGLVGLSRAWLLAGAAAVIVSAWPTPDDSGRFFSAFYRHFQNTSAASLAQRAAVSLRDAQLEMQKSSGYSSSPSLWAAYSIISKE